MDPHFHEYLAAIAGLSAIYGERSEDHPTEFHGDLQAVVGEEPAVVTA